MPSVFGSISINSVDGGVVNYGDSFSSSPVNSSKSNSGSGGGNVGNFINTNNFISSTSPNIPGIRNK
ncbi:spore germination protein [Halobacillus trueperi]|uniref:Spore germination protein n=1 Tax=Halobacillus trueperi TaxID=156205 RepID=A0A3D8VKJ8_9BACI|nr:spore germination protein [Halobacillus trueperi]RDY69872.1 spore germination protein [Halobacillus trueperi]